MSPKFTPIMHAKVTPSATSFHAHTVPCKFATDRGTAAGNRLGDSAQFKRYLSTVAASLSVTLKDARLAAGVAKHEGQVSSDWQSQKPLNHLKIFK
jgi:hypothetical protein